MMQQSVQRDTTDSEFVENVPCDACGSKDNAALFTDGHTYCFGCKAYTHGDEETSGPSTNDPKAPSGLLKGEYHAIPSRKLTEETCRKFGYMLSRSNGQPVHVASYRDAKGNAVAQKLRTKDKKFPWTGEPKKATLFGSHLWSNGKKIVITEGEIDCMTVSQIQGHRWPTVSLQNGAQSAPKALLDAWEYLSNFEEIILMFDMDDAGRENAVAAAEVLPIGKVKIASLPYKDANECLLNGASGDIITAIFQAAPYRPDGIISAVDMRDVISEVDAMSAITYPFKRLNEITKGVQKSTLTTIAAGSGVGKSTLVRELAYGFLKQGQNVGMLMLEETPKRSAQGIVGLHMSKNITIDPDAATQEEVEAAYDDLMGPDYGRFYLFDHFGSTAMDVISNRIRYMNKALGCDIIFLDHISILVSGLTGKVTDERRLVDDIITHLRTSVVQELGISLFIVSHLKRPQSDAGHEGGAKVQLSQLRSSHSIAQLSDFCLGLQVDAEEPTSGRRELVVLKNRFTGEVGFAGSLQYNRDTGRLIDADDVSPF